MDHINLNKGKIKKVYDALIKGSSPFTYMHFSNSLRADLEDAVKYLKTHIAVLKEEERKLKDRLNTLKAYETELACIENILTDER